MLPQHRSSQGRIGGHHGQIRGRRRRRWRRGCWTGATAAVAQTLHQLQELIGLRGLWGRWWSLLLLLLRKHDAESQLKKQSIGVRLGDLRWWWSGCNGRRVEHGHPVVRIGRGRGDWCRWSLRLLLLLLLDLRQEKLQQVFHWHTRSSRFLWLWLLYGGVVQLLENVSATLVQRRNLIVRPIATTDAGRNWSLDRSRSSESWRDKCRDRHGYICRRVLGKRVLSTDLLWISSSV